MQSQKSVQLQQSRQKSHSTVQFKKFEKLSNRDPIQKKHCPQDQACFHCCQCWLNFKAQYNKRITILQQKLSSKQKQNELLKQCIEKLTRQSTQLKAKVKNTTDLQTLKENLRKEIQKKVDQDIKLKIMIQKEKIDNLTEKVKVLQQMEIQLKKENQTLQNKLEKKKIEYEQKVQQLIIMQKKLQAQKAMKQKQIQKNLNLTEQINKINARITDLNKAFDKKSQSISSLQTNITHGEKVLSRQLSLLAQKQFQKTQLTLQSSNKSQMLEKITAQNHQHTKSISLLSSEKKQLSNLVGSLKEELQVSDRHKSVLKLAWNQAQLQAEKNALKLQNLKYDVNMLKYTLA